MKKVIIMMLAVLVMAGTTKAFAEDVYATKNGKRYHKADCLLTKNKGAKSIALEEAEKKGLKPCHRCFSAATTKAVADIQTAALPAEAVTK